MKIRKWSDEQSGFSFLETSLAVGALMILSVGGTVAYSSINENNIKSAVDSTSQTGYAAALSALTDFDENSNPADALKSVESKNIILSHTGSTKDSLCVTSIWQADPENFSSKAGNCNFSEIPEVLAPNNPVITDTITKITYQCDTEVTDKVHIRNDVIGSGVITASDGTSKSLVVSNKEIEPINLKAGIEYKLEFDGKYKTLASTANFSGQEIRQCLKSIDYIGADTGVTKFEFLGKGAFSVPETLPASVTDLQAAFAYSKFNQDISGWDTSNVTNMALMFLYNSVFNQPIGSWDTSNVVNMTSMFEYAISFDQPIGEWKTSNLTTARNMFAYAAVFNQPIGEWSTSNLITMESMFIGAKKFDQPIGDWNTSKVKSMLHTFNGATSFNKPIGDWDTSQVMTMESMFYNAIKFDQPIGGWDTSNVKNMASMFTHSHAFNQPIGNWNVSSVENMVQMFSNTRTFNQPIGGWDTSNVKSISWIFTDATAFAQDISAWDLSQATDKDKMFEKR